jgi:hypothetical protein
MGLSRVSRPLAVNQEGFRDASRLLVMVASSSFENTWGTLAETGALEYCVIESGSLRWAQKASFAEKM